MFFYILCFAVIFEFYIIRTQGWKCKIFWPLIISSMFLIILVPKKVLHTMITSKESQFVKIWRVKLCYFLYPAFDMRNISYSSVSAIVKIFQVNISFDEVTEKHVNFNVESYLPVFLLRSNKYFNHILIPVIPIAMCVFWSLDPHLHICWDESDLRWKITKTLIVLRRTWLQCTPTNVFLE